MGFLLYCEWKTDFMGLIWLHVADLLEDLSKEPWELDS